MSEKIEGHVQFNGGRYVFFETYQPALACEDPINHSTCKAASEKRNAEITEAEQAEREQKRQADAAEVEEQAKRKLEDDRAALVKKAGVMKSDAKRINGVRMVEAHKKLKDDAAVALAELESNYQQAVEKIQKSTAEAIDKAQAERDAEDRRIDGIDWIAEASK